MPPCVQVGGQLYKGVIPGYEAWGTALCAGTNFIMRADTLQACPAMHARPSSAAPACCTLLSVPSTRDCNVLRVGQRHGWFPAGLGAVGLAISQELRVTCHLAFFYDEVLATGAPFLTDASRGCKAT